MMSLLPTMDLPPEAQRALGEISLGIIALIQSLILPTAFLYIALLALIKRRMKEFEVTTWFSIVTFLLNSWREVVNCSSLRSIQLFAGGL